MVPAGSRCWFRTDSLVADAVAPGSFQVLQPTSRLSFDGSSPFTLAYLGSTVCFGVTEGEHVDEHCWLFLLIFVVKKLCLEGRIFFSTDQFTISEAHLEYIGHFPWILYLVRETSTLKKRLFQLDDGPNLYILGKWLEITQHPLKSGYHISWSSLSSIVFHHLSHTKEPGAHCATQLIFRAFCVTERHLFLSSL